MRVNLLSETIEILSKYNKTLKDVKWFGFCEERFSLSKITEILDIDYDNGFGGTEIYGSLVVCGRNWWLERNEYDGSEWWEYKEKPKKPNKLAKIFYVSQYDKELRNQTKERKQEEENERLKEEKRKRNREHQKRRKARRKANLIEQIGQTK